MTRSFFPAVLLLLPTAAATAQEWNQWRGPARTGEVGPGRAFPAALSGERLVVVWEAGLEEGYASPVVSDGRVFTVSTKDKTLEVARAHDLRTGKLLWETVWEGAMKVPFFAAKNGSWVRSTPAAAGDGVYIGGMRDVLVKLDAVTGEERWRVDFMSREGTDLPAFGMVSSPLIEGGAVYVQAGCAVTRLDAATGATVWRSLENRHAMLGSAFSSPVLATVQGTRQLVTQTRSALAGLDPETGEVLWTTPVEAFRGMNILTPTIIGEDRVFTATYGSGCSLFRIDRGEDGSFAITRVWHREAPEGYMSSPLAMGGHVYLLGRDQRMHCLDLADGSVAWSTPEKFGDYWSMIHQGNRILALDQRGELILVEASPESFRAIDRRRVSAEPTWAHLGLEENFLLIRSLRKIIVHEFR